MGLSLYQEIQADLKEVERELYRYVDAPHPVLAESSAHLLKAGGKRLRPAFALLAGKFHNYSLDTLMPLAVALEMIHMATLVHDDVIDGSFTRRGIPTVKAKWGDDISLHTGDYLFARSLILISSYEDQRIARILADVSVQMCQGEIQQIATSYDLGQSSRDYFYRIKRKTALLISASCQLGAIAVNAPNQWIRALKYYGFHLGMAFQIGDDILDMIADEEELGKPVGSDLRQGILTLPAIYALRYSPRKQQLADLLVERPKTEAEVKEAIKIIRESGAIEFSFDVVERYVAKAKRQLAVLPDVPAKDTMTYIADFIRVRSF
ncbi:heptaprenyl diphosphate synthase [Clostridiales bacterium PH28_bin88]|nr:heptaprenyl diphosphate synthase [Clostridiales bacterium PH28_bin88]